MRRALLLLVTIALLPLGVACGDQHRKYEEAQAVNDLRAIFPAMEAYWTDHETFAGVTPARLRRYDPAIGEISISRATKSNYCLEAVHGDSHAFFELSQSEIMLGSCDDPKNGKPFDSPSKESRDDSSESSDLGDQLRAAAPVIEVYHEEHNTYDGMTLAKLREWDPATADISIVATGKETYCIEIAVNDESAFKQGPAGEIKTGTCPN